MPRSRRPGFLGMPVFCAGAAAAAESGVTGGGALGSTVIDRQSSRAPGCGLIPIWLVTGRSGPAAGM